MSAPSLGVLWDRGLDVLNTIVDATTKTILAFIGDVKVEEQTSSEAEWWQHDGFASRPPKPDPKTKASQVVILRGGDYDAVIASRDIRSQEMFEGLDHGETCLYAAGGDGTAQARLLLKDDSSFSLFTRASKTAPSVVFQGKADGTLQMFSELGAVSIDSNGITLQAGGAALRVGSDGSVYVNCKSFVVAAENQAVLKAGTVLLGQAPVIPMVVGPTGISGVGSTSVLGTP